MIHTGESHLCLYHLTMLSFNLFYIINSQLIVKTSFLICIIKEIKRTLSLYWLDILRSKHLETQPLEYSILKMVLMNHIVSQVKYVCSFCGSQTTKYHSPKCSAHETVDASIHWAYLSANICLIIIIMWESDYDRSS